MTLTSMPRRYYWSRSIPFLLVLPGSLITRRPLHYLGSPLICAQGPYLGLSRRFAVVSGLQIIRSPACFPQGLRRRHLAHPRVACTPCNCDNLAGQKHTRVHLCQLSNIIWRVTTSIILPGTLHQLASNPTCGNYPEHLRLMVCQAIVLGLLPKTRLPCKGPEDLVVVGVDSYCRWVGHLHWGYLLSMHA